jgi:hypothetical protein
LYLSTIQKGDAAMKGPIFLAFPVIADPLARDDSTIPNHFVQKYDDDIRLVAQQKKSRLEETVTRYDGIVGASRSVDRHGQTEAQEVKDRHGDTSTIEVPHVRRWLDLSDWDHATLLDHADTLKVLENPGNKYVQGAVAAMNRRKDKVIIAAMFGNARTVDNTLSALPAGQKILDGGTDISMAKIRSAIEILNANEADSPEEEGGLRTFVYTSAQLTELMADSTLTSADYNTLKALQDYTMSDRMFMGLYWKRLEFLPKTGNIRSCGIYGKSYMALGVGDNMRNEITIRSDKRNAKQFYSFMSIGAVRVEDEGVVQIDCDESA